MASARIARLLAAGTAAAVLAGGGIALGSTSSPNADSVAAFCAEHPVTADDFWTGEPASAGYLKEMVSAARFGQAGYAVSAGLVCADLDRLQDGGAVQVPGTSGRAAKRAVLITTIHRLEHLTH